MTIREKRCEDCVCLISKNGVMCCDELWGKPCDDIGNDECPEEIEIEDVQEMQEKSKVKIDHGVANKPKEKKPKTTKVSDEKKMLFNNILGCLNTIYDENVQILTENKLISVQIGEKTFKIDLIEQRKPKK